jgi:hypothetical protein
MSIHEPATLLTDCLLAVLSAWCGWRLHRDRPAANRAARWWSHALWLTAVSALIGGCYHGLAPNFPAVADAWWCTTLLLISLLSAAMGLSLLHEIVPGPAVPRWRMLIVAKFAFFAGVILAHPVFVVAVSDYGLIMLAWAAAALWTGRSWRPWMLTAIALSAVAAVVQQLHLGLSEGFNHNDVYHVIQALAIVGFYRAGITFGAGPAN